MSATEFKCIVYSHLGAKDPMKVIAQHGPALKKALDREETLLFLFLDKGWYELLNTAGYRFQVKEFAKQINEVEQTKSALEDSLRKQGLSNRVRVITAADLEQIVNNLRGDRAGAEAMRLRRFLVADASSVRYDTSKVVEAVIRIRHLGSGIPIFRVDWDALFNDTTLQASNAPYALSSAFKFHNKNHANYRVSTFVTSGSYMFSRSDEAKPIAEWDADNWINGFATRPFPAMLATKELWDLEGTERVDGKRPREEAERIETAFKLAETNAVNVELMKDYYGIEDQKGQGIGVRTMVNAANVVVPNEGLTAIGSNPLDSVISGALMCLNDSAITDLPPFSNFRRLVMWIDDHLKYALHRELLHFGVIDDGNPICAFNPRVENCFLYKNRAPVSRIWRYTLGDYLPILLRGAIMDAWINAVPQANLHAAADHTRGAYRRGPLPLALEGALTRGIVDAHLASTVRAEFWRVALERIDQVRSMWSKLRTDTEESFAAIWIQGQVRPYLGKLGVMEAGVGSGASPATSTHPLLAQPTDWIGWGATRMERPATWDRAGAMEYLTPAAFEDLEILIDDTMTYIDWVLEWPRFIQSVRAIAPRSLAVDVGYIPS